MKLGVNIDHVATIRQARKTPYPDLTQAARLAEAGGADFITVHLREDRRHVVDDDLPPLKNAIQTYINLEIAATHEMRRIALALMPPKVCVVPERRAELTTEGGLDVCRQQAHIKQFCAPLIVAGIEVSLFIDPNIAQIQAAKQTGVKAIELHTGQYAYDGDIVVLQQAAAAAADAGLKTHAGHGLHLDNVAAVADIEGVVELNIGHSIIARALFVGLQEAVREMAAVVKR